MADILRDDVASIIASEVMKINNAKAPETDRVIFMNLSVPNGSCLTRFKQTLLFSRDDIKHTWKADIHYERDEEELDTDTWFIDCVQKEGTDEIFITLNYLSSNLIYKFNAKKGELSYFSSSNGVTFNSDDGVKCDNCYNYAEFEGEHEGASPFMDVTTETYVAKH